MWEMSGGGGKKAAINRLRKELQNFVKDPPPYLSVSRPRRRALAAAAALARFRCCAASASHDDPCADQFAAHMVAVIRFRRL